LGIDVGGGAGEEDGLARVDEVGDLDGRGVEGDFDGLAAATLDGCGILGPGTVVIVWIGACGLRYRDAWLHYGSSSLHDMPSSDGFEIFPD
jgi:hypothetical protein